jgi:hypothetical protein
MFPIDPFQKVLATGGLIQKSQDIHKGRFSGAGGSHDRHKFTLFDRKRNSSESLNLHLPQGVNLGQILNLYESVHLIQQSMQIAKLTMQN